MKIKTAVVIGLLVLNGSAFAAAAGTIQAPPLFFKSPERMKTELPKTPISGRVDQPVPMRVEKPNSKLNRLVLEYQTSRALSSSA